MNEEEKEAIETIRFLKDLKWYTHAFDNGTEVLTEEEKQDIDIGLNLIKKQQKELEKKDKIIDKMAEFISNLCRGIQVVRDNFDIDIRNNYNVTKIQKYDKQSIVKDFINLVEKENK